MPPKKDAPSKKTEAKQKEKVVEDKTFGLKNKKGKKQQTFIKNVTHQVQHGDQKASAIKKEEEKKAAAKQDKAALAAELNALFKPVQEQKVPKGVDPKSVLCAFFKSGACTKGHKCKFSHDLNIERKAEKKNIYEEEKKEEGMEDWDEEKLEEVVNKKHGEKNKSMPATSIICKFFLDALENNKYGWFWSCPNGDTCHYRHALPPGFVLKKDAKRMEEEKEVVTIEQLVEAERAALSGQSLTKVTIESFLRWKERKRAEKCAKLNDEKEAKRQGVKDGKVVGVSGRELFEFNPDLVMGGDDEGADDVTYKREEDDEEAVACQVRELTLEMLAEEAQFVREPAPAAPEPEGAVGGAADAAAAAAAEPPAVQNGLQAAADEDIDENLFDCEDLEDLDSLDDDDDD